MRLHVCGLLRRRRHTSLLENSLLLSVLLINCGFAKSQHLSSVIEFTS